MAVPKQSLCKNSQKANMSLIPYRSVFEDENGQLTLEGHEKLKNELFPQKKRSELEEFAMKNSKAAMYDLATCYLHGYLGLEKDFSKFLDLTYQAALFDYALAYFSLAELSMPKEKDKSKKAEMEKKGGKDEKMSIDKPSYLTDARYESIAPSDSNYLTWLKKAASKGLGIAECHLGRWYKNHPEVENNLSLAKKLFLSASSENKGKEVSKMARNALAIFFPEPSVEKLRMEKAGIDKIHKEKLPMLFSSMNGMNGHGLSGLSELQQYKRSRESLHTEISAEEILLKQKCDALKSEKGSLPDTLQEQQQAIAKLTGTVKEQITQQIRNKERLSELRKKLKQFE